MENLTVREYNELIWHQDGAPPHCVRPVTEFLNNRFRLWIGRQGPLRWPANSPDLTPLDNFLWGYLKNRIYYDRTYNLEELRHRIKEEITGLNNENHKFIRNAVNRLRTLYQECYNNAGSHIKN